MVNGELASSRRARLRFVVAALFLSTACGAPKPNAPPAPRATALRQGPLSDYVPAAGLRWMLTGSPRAIGQNDAFREALALLLPPERLTAFEEGSGVDLRQVESALIAGFDLGTLYLLTPPRGASATIVGLFRNRIVGGEHHQFPHPELERVYGLIGTTPEFMVRAGDQWIAVATHDFTLGRVVEAFARGKLKSPSALRGAALSTLSPTLPAAVATFYAPGPFAGEWARGARGLLANALAVRISLLPLPPHHARFVLELTGEFPPSGADDLAQAFRDLGGSPLGKLLALDEQDTPARVQERPERLTLEVDLKVAPIARGLRAAVVSDVWEIMQLPAPSSP